MARLLIHAHLVVGVVAAAAAGAVTFLHYAFALNQESPGSGILLAIYAAALAVAIRGDREIRQARPTIERKEKA